METKHTPGEWSAEFTSNYSRGMEIVARGEGIHRTVAVVPHEWPEDKANAALISAAPELLDACRAFVHWYAEDSSESNCETAYTSAVRAIAKAEGEPQP